MSKRQENMQLAMSYLRAIVEVLPRGQAEERPWREWMRPMAECVDGVCVN